MTSEVRSSRAWLCVFLSTASDKTTHPKAHLCSTRFPPPPRFRAFLVDNSNLAVSTLNHQDEKANAVYL